MRFSFFNLERKMIDHLWGWLAGIGVVGGAACAALDWYGKLSDEDKAVVLKKARKVAIELFKKALETLADSQKERVFSVVRDRMGASAY